MVWSRGRGALPRELGRSFPNTYRRGYGRKQGRPGAADGGEAGAQAAEKTRQRLAAEMIPAEVDGGHRRPWRTGGSALSLGLLVTEKSSPGGKEDSNRKQ